MTKRNFSVGDHLCNKFWILFFVALSHEVAEKWKATGKKKKKRGKKKKLTYVGLVVQNISFKLTN